MLEKGVLKITPIEKSTPPEAEALAARGAIFMGGLGSGWQGSKKATVEESLTLSAFHARAAEGACHRCSDVWVLGLDPRHHSL